MFIYIVIFMLRFLKLKSDNCNRDYNSLFTCMSNENTGQKQTQVKDHTADH